MNLTTKHLKVKRLPRPKETNLYVVLNEEALSLVKSEDDMDVPKKFKSKEDANKWAQAHLNLWQVIHVWFFSSHHQHKL